MIASSLPLELETLLHSELRPSEKLIWTGQPLGPSSGRSTIPLVIFGIPWTAFSVFWVVGAFGATRHASSSPSPFPFNLMAWLFPLFGVPFVLLGLGMLSSPYWMRRHSRKIVYALTNERALILSPTWRGGISTRSIPPEHLTDRTRNQQPDGSGSLIFTHLTTSNSDGDGGTTVVTVGFDNIADVREVDALIEQTYRPSEQG